MALQGSTFVSAKLDYRHVLLPRQFDINNHSRMSQAHSCLICAFGALPSCRTEPFCSLAAVTARKPSCGVFGQQLAIELLQRPARILVFMSILLHTHQHMLKA